MFYPDKIEGNQYAIKNEWREVTIRDAEKLKAIELPEYFKRIYKEDDKEERVKLVSELTDKDLDVVIPDVQSEVLCLLSDIPRDIVFRLEANALREVYNEILAPIHLGIVFYAPAKVEKIEHFKIGKVTYKLPFKTNILGNDVPMYTETALPFCDALEFTKANIEGLSSIVAILCRPENEKYKEENTLKRSEMFKDLPMSIAWNVFFILNETVETIDSQFKWVFGKSSTDSKTKSAFNRSGLNSFGCIAWMYEVAQSGICGDIDKIKEMRLYEFMSVLSYLRSSDKLIRYAQR